jgi:uncharacterized protein (DUF433 family)
MTKLSITVTGHKAETRRQPEDSNMQTVNYIEVNRTGLAEIKEAKLLVGDILILMFLYEWSADDLVECFPKLTSAMINEALEYASANPDTVEGQFYSSENRCPLMRILELI